MKVTRAIVGGVLVLALGIHLQAQQSDHDFLLDLQAKIAAQVQAQQLQTALGPVVFVPPGGNLQAALNAATSGAIELQAGAFYDGNFTMPPHGDTVVTLRTRVSLPVRRVTLADLPQLATIRSLIAGATPVNIPDGSHHWKLDGIAITQSGGNTYGLIRCGSGDGHASLAAIAHHVEIDRVVAYVGDTVTERRGVQLNCSDVVLHRSTVTGPKEAGADSQAIAVWDGPGRILIEDNDLRAAGEVILFGGSLPSLSGLMAANVTIRGNDLSWDPAWKTSPWTKKNLLEVKCGRGFTITDNRLSHAWAAAQSGSAILFTVRNENGKAPWCAVEDITFERNVVTDVDSAINILAFDDNSALAQQHPEPAQRIAVRNNLFIVRDRCYQLLQGPKAITIDHNTCIGSGNVLTLEGPKAAGFVFTNNLQKHNAYGIIGSNHAPGMDSITAFFDAPVIATNVFAGAAGIASYPATNLIPTVPTFAAQFAPDWSLVPTSTWKKAGTDGADLGADITKLPR